MDANLADMLAGVAARTPDKPLYTFLFTDRDDQTVTAAELHRDATHIAALLSDEGVGRGHIVPLAFDHGYELVAAFWGAIYRGAVPTILPYISAEARSPARFEHVIRLVRFTHPPAVVATAAAAPALAQALDGTGRVVALPVDVLGHPAEAAGPWPIRDPRDPPYIQFSSGTTGAPKGVVLSHAALLHYCRQSAEHYAVTEEDVTVGWLPLYHDMGLLNELFEPLWARHLSVLMSPAAWLREPHRLLLAVHRFRGSMSWLPNFAVRYCVRRIRDEQIAAIDLSCWRVVGNASEPVQVEDLRAFAERFAPYGFDRNALTVCYGMAEHVAGVAWTPHDRYPDVDWVDGEALERGDARVTLPGAPGSRAIVSCGRPLGGATLRIVDDAGRTKPDRVVGEILVSGPMVFSGYYARIQESAAALRDGWLYTGDLGYLAEGQLYVCGRKKDLIIVAGRNVYPHYLESIATAALGEHGRFAAAFGIANPELGTEMPVIVCEMTDPPDEPTCTRLRQEVRDQVQRVAGLYVGEVAFVDKGWVVKTTSGKINRAATRDKFLAAKRDGEPAAHGAPATNGATAIEGELLDIWRALFRQPTLGRDDDFFALGGDSLLAAQLVLYIEERLRRVLPDNALLEAPTIAALAHLLDREQSPAGAHQTLVALQPIARGSRPAVFFCVHGFGGGVLDYKPLADALGPEQPFYGLQARGMTGDERDGHVDSSIEHMAAYYVRTIRSFQPRGPYYLGGYCFGGVVAYEMARQLESENERVALLAVFDGYAPEAAAPNRWRREWRHAVRFVRALPYWVGDYLRLGRLERQARARRVIRVARKRLLRLAGVDVALQLDDLFDTAPCRPAQIQRLLETHLVAARQYNPGSYRGRLVLFRSPQRLWQAPDRDMGWGKLVAEPVDVQMITGSHGTILQAPNVQTLAAKLEAFLS